MFFQTKERAQPSLDCFDKMKEIITAILQNECPEHSPYHHFLLTLNQKLQHYDEARQYYRNNIDLYCPIGTFAQHAYELANKKHNQLSILIRAYIYLSDDTQRSALNHHFTFSNVKIERLYEQFSIQKSFIKLLKIEAAFWEAFKEEIVPIVCEIE